MYFFRMKRSFLLRFFKKPFVLLRELVKHRLYLTHFDDEKDGLLDCSSPAISSEAKKAVRITNTISFRISNKRE